MLGISNKFVVRGDERVYVTVLFDGSRENSYEFSIDPDGSVRQYHQYKQVVALPVSRITQRILRFWDENTEKLCEYAAIAPSNNADEPQEKRRRELFWELQKLVRATH